MSSDLRVFRSSDLVWARRVMTHPKIWRHISDDMTPSPDRFCPPDPETVFYLQVLDAEEDLGLFVFVPVTGICLEVHTALLPAAWGSRARAAALAAREWIWAETLARRIITSVPITNRLALRFAKRAGLIEFGRNPGAIQKRGKVIDLILLGISRPE